MTSAIDGASQRRVCQLLAVNRSTLWRHQRSPSPKSSVAPKVNDKDQQLKQRLKQVAHQYPSWGYRRLWATVRYQDGLLVNIKKVHRLCKELGLQVRSRRQRPKPRVQDKRSRASRSNQRWAIDASQFCCGRDGWGHIIAIIDCHDRQCVGYEIALRGRAREAECALENACLERFGTVFGEVDQRPVLRSDNGLIFNSKRFVRSCREYGLTQEFITPYCPQQNGMIERFFRSMKEECVWLTNFSNFQDARTAITNWIEFYNQRRPHQALKYCSPNDFRAQNLRLVA